MIEFLIIYIWFLGRAFQIGLVCLNFKRADGARIKYGLGAYFKIFIIKGGFINWYRQNIINIIKKHTNNVVFTENQLYIYIIRKKNIT